MEYDDYTIRNCTNCQAQNYLFTTKINFGWKMTDSYIMKMAEPFVPETLENVLNGMAPQTFLLKPLTNDVSFKYDGQRWGRGIQKKFSENKRTPFSMPDYHIDNERKTVSHNHIW